MFMVKHINEGNDPEQQHHCIRQLTTAAEDFACAIKTRLLIDNGSKKSEMPAVDYFIRRGSKVA
uniref:HDC15190 n=1 Tax=Drosophila melanogaster TaxID=7227 RepID=Q6IJC9_DROME|nr:TPA_inf: HDC15190 [Drosophila melanogaster]